ncbi:hypothetical protein A8F94_06720 [Bacillus sp. FJAT-27225]|uniref:DUF4430 domain-containing protein n=1 Tax=Bacillus sp. FJAT-27225 TaxID=1743144 RepID=UPI00080C21E7|nr:DUF4430 domain-containing protein [Bacillus sp. FJAT-27225]OCA87548.1 hypothetical protein A8F94_06720 [Bacillus sp. FJAT-27225]
MGKGIIKRYLCVFSLLAALVLSGCGTAAEPQQQTGEPKDKIALTEDAASNQNNTQEEKPVSNPEETNNDSTSSAANEEAGEEEAGSAKETVPSEKASQPSGSTETSSAGSKDQGNSGQKSESKASSTEGASSTKATAPSNETGAASSKASAQPTSKPAAKPAPKPAPKPVPVATATVSIKGPDEVGMIMGAKKVELKEGDTVIDVLLRAAGKSIFVDYSGSGATAYVAGIDNYYEFDYGPRSGWICKKNGVTLEKGAGSTKVSEGDRIEWIYTEDFLKKE